MTPWGCLDTSGLPLVPPHSPLCQEDEVLLRRKHGMEGLSFSERLQPAWVRSTPSPRQGGVSGLLKGLLYKGQGLKKLEVAWVSRQLMNPDCGFLIASSRRRYSGGVLCVAFQFAQEHSVEKVQRRVPTCKRHGGETQGLLPSLYPTDEVARSLRWEKNSHRKCFLGAAFRGHA